MPDRDAANAPQGLKLGSPCQNEHTINRAPAPDDDAYWITCGDETLSRVVIYTDALPDEQVRTWSELTMARHEIACWKQLARDVRDWLEIPGGEPDSNELLDRINAALREGKYAHG